MSKDKTAIEELVESSPPVPASWIKLRGASSYLAGRWQKEDSLWWPKSIRSEWLKRCQGKEGKHLPWATWSALRAMDADSLPGGLVGPVHSIKTGKFQGAFLEVDGIKVTFRRSEKDELLLRLGGKGDGILTPGSTLEEKLVGAGFRKKGQAKVEELRDDDLLEDSEPEFEKEGKGSFKELVFVEVEHARNFLLADPVLGLAALLGPIPIESLNSSRGRRRASGYLGSQGELTKAGWWRLAYESNQGIGEVEKLREKRLTKTRNKRHLSLIQKICLEFMEDGFIPLGVEYSAAASYISNTFHRYRADALLANAEGSLVWVEVMRRSLTRLGDKTERKYSLLETDCLPLIADQMDKPVKYVLRLPLERIERMVKPLGERY